MAEKKYEYCYIPDKPVQEDGWLSPEGVFYVCAFTEHSKAAKEIANRSTNWLEEHGWLHISSSQIVNVSCRITQSQRDTLHDMVQVNQNSWYSRAITEDLSYMEEAY